MERDTPGTVNGIHPSEQGKSKRSKTETKEKSDDGDASDSDVSEKEEEGFFQRWKKKLLG